MNRDREVYFYLKRYIHDGKSPFIKGNLSLCARGINNTMVIDSDINKVIQFSTIENFCDNVLFDYGSHELTIYKKQSACLLKFCNSNRHILSAYKNAVGNNEDIFLCATNKLLIYSKMPDNTPIELGFSGGDIYNIMIDILIKNGYTEGSKIDFFIDINFSIK